MALVLDTGVLYAALNSADPAHQHCAELLVSSAEPLVIPAPVLVELDYWVRKAATVEAWGAFCDDVEAGAYSIAPLDTALLLEASRLEAKYSDLIGLVDAAVFATCERLGEDKIATLDRRHFSILKTVGGETLRILPER